MIAILHILFKRSILSEAIGSYFVDFDKLIFKVYRDGGKTQSGPYDIK